MWHLKIKYKHSDCLFTDKVHELGISCFHYYLGRYKKGKFTFVTGMQKIDGDPQQLKKYVTYLKKAKKIQSIEVKDKTIFLSAKHSSKLNTYTTLYDPQFLHPTPKYVGKDGIEVIEIACWTKKPLQDLIKSLKEDIVTTHLEILQFVNKKMDDVYVSKLLPKLAPKQLKAIQLAYAQGYYEYPRKIDLEKLAKISKVSKATFRENLRRAESKLLPMLLSK